MSATIPKQDFSALPKRSEKAINSLEIITNPAVQIKHLHEKTDGYIAFFRKNNIKTHTRHYKLDELPAVLKEWITADSYLSMNTFYTPRRVVTNLREIRSAFVDIDCYNVGFTSEQMAIRLKEDYFGTVLPVPNMLIHSGRGLNLVWFLDPISGLAVERWNKLQRAILNTVKDLGADPAAVDAARVFRLAGSVNSKSQTVVSAEILHEYRYTFDEIVEEYFPAIKKRVKQPKKGSRPNRLKKPTSSSVKRLWNEYTLIVARTKDIEKIVEIKNRLGITEGYRERALFLYRYWVLVLSDDKEKAKEQMLKLNSRMLKPLPERTLLQDTKSAERYYDSEEPFKITHRKVIEWLDIKSDEYQREMNTIITRSEDLRRDREYRREKRGSVSWDEHTARIAAQKDEKVARLAKIKEENPGATQRELAALMGVSVGTINNLLKQK